MKRLIAALAATTSLVLSSTAAAGTLTGFADATSNYISRGTAQDVHGRPALQAGATYQTQNGWYATTFASTMNFGEGTTKELDFFAGKKTTFGATTVDVGLASINYPANHLPWNFVEYDIKVDHPLGKGNVGAWVGYTDHYFNIYGRSVWTEVHASYPVTAKITVSGAAANQYVPHDFDYRTWNIGATYSVTPTVSLDARYSDTDRHDLDPVFGTYGSQLSVTLTKTF
jgi:uncharacterized protein (TIGR02001 family)